MVQAYILIQTEVAAASRVAEAVRRVPAVIQADELTGPYDVIVMAEAESIEELGRVVVADVQNVPEITRTLTCPVVPLR